MVSQLCEQTSSMERHSRQYCEIKRNALSCKMYCDSAYARMYAVIDGWVRLASRSSNMFMHVNEMQVMSFGDDRFFQTFNTFHLACASGVRVDTMAAASFHCSHSEVRTRSANGRAIQCSHCV